MQSNTGYEQMLEVLNATKMQSQKLKDDNYNDYCLLLRAVEKGRVTNDTELRSIMDGFLGHFEEERFLELYEQLCKCCYEKHPELITEHVKLFQAHIEWMDNSAKKHRFPLAESDSRPVPELTGEKFEMLTMALTRSIHKDDPWMLDRLNEIESELNRRRSENLADRNEPDA